MLQLREEAKKLSQRYKIAATELRNITTAITLNKKQQRTIQNGLFKVRLHHQMLLKRYFISNNLYVFYIIVIIKMLPFAVHLM